MVVICILNILIKVTYPMAGLGGKDVYSTIKMHWVNINTVLKTDFASAFFFTHAVVLTL